MFDKMVSHVLARSSVLPQSQFFSFVFFAKALLSIERRSLVGILFGSTTVILFGLTAVSPLSSSRAADLKADAPYCLALRGNGELAPAQWGALSQLVERMGFPSVMAGGSSASVSLFLLESISQNPTLQNQSPDSQRLRAALLLKSLPAYLGVVANRPEWREMAALAMLLKRQNGGENMEFREWLKKMVDAEPDRLAQLIRENFLKIQSALRIAVDYGVVDPETFKPLVNALMDLEKAQNAKPPVNLEPILTRVRFFAHENFQAIELLGKFDAKNDSNLFFRRGIVSFSQLSRALGRVANFYAGLGMNADQLKKFEAFSAACAIPSKGVVWMDLVKSKPICQELFNDLVEGYRESSMKNFRSHLTGAIQSRENQRVGEYIRTLPSTAVLVGDGHQAAQAALLRYEQEMSPTFGDGFQVPLNTVRFGYWGLTGDLQRVEQNLQDNFHDAKSKLFKSLGEATWQTVLSLSPAEPGLARLQNFKVTGSSEGLTSAGGWSDLHPVTILKAAGCQQVVYVTRVGGESLFGQGVAKRLFGFTEEEIPWSRLETQPDEVKRQNRIANNNGNFGDLSSRWSQLYNLANQFSSFSQALKLADAVVCTDWDRFNITDEGAIEAMTRQAFGAPWGFTDLRSNIGQQAIIKGWLLVTPSDNGFDPTKGFRPYAGCLPF